MWLLIVRADGQHSPADFMKRDYDSAMEPDITPRGTPSPFLKLKTWLTSWTVGRIAASIAIMADAGLIALTAWRTAFIAGAQITKESVYTGSITVSLAVHLIGGLLAAVVSAVTTIVARQTLAKGEALRTQVGNWWICAHAFFVFAVIANSIYVEIKL